jgi:hypothetical protein
MELKNEMKYEIDLNQKKLERELEVDLLKEKEEKIEKQNAKKYVSEIFFYCLKRKIKKFKEKYA